MKSASSILTSAPGKLFLVGEYAVLEGAPAILSAVNRRAHVKLADAAGDHWLFTARNLGLSRLKLDTAGTAGRHHPAGSSDKLRVFNAVRRQVNAYLPHELPPLEVHIDTSDFARDSHKLGLGSSAAVAAALTTALLAHAGVRPERDLIEQLAIQAHKNAQDGRGSGGDVATAVHGGTIRYTAGNRPTMLTWPAGLTCVAVITGTGASTTELVGRVHDYRDRAPDAYKTDMEPLLDLANRAAQALDQAESFASLAHDYFTALTRLDQNAQAGIVTPLHRELSTLAARHDAVFKSSGAGGGDVGLLFTTPGTDACAVHHAFRAAGATMVPLEFAAPGVSIDSGDTFIQDSNA